ncbi:MAG: ABC transporter ATP-binding protein [Myxococcaceae bacterium]
MPGDTLEFEDIHKSFHGAEVLRGLTASIPLSKVTFVVGKSGGGKSVLCRLAVGLEKPDSGKVVLLGAPVSDLIEDELMSVRRRAPYLVQGPALLDWLTVEQNVALAAKASPEGSVEEAIARVGIGEFAQRFPPQLSPGVKKRAAIARALVLKPRYLLLDEPTTGLDRLATKQVNEVLRKLKQEGLGALVVSHDYRSLEATADEVLMVSDGTVGFRGTPAEFLTSSAKEIRALTNPEVEGVHHG